MRQYTECLSYTPTPSGNLINSGTRWNIEGSLIRQIEVEEKEISCSNRTLLVPVRFRTHQEAMGICQQLGGKYLESFPHFARYLSFYSLVRSSPAMERHCKHGGRFMMWLPYLGWADLSQPPLNLTHYGTSLPLSMSAAWRSNYPRSDDRPFCVVARMGI